MDAVIEIQEWDVWERESDRKGGFAAIIIVVTIITREGLSEEDVKVAVAMEGVPGEGRQIIALKLRLNQLSFRPSSSSTLVEKVAIWHKIRWQ